MNDNLKSIGRDYNWLRKEANKFDIEPEQALIITFDKRHPRNSRLRERFR